MAPGFRERIAYAPMDLCQALTVHPSSATLSRSTADGAVERGESFIAELVGHAGVDPLVAAASVTWWSRGLLDVDPGRAG
jgi:hypothetical protein